MDEPQGPAPDADGKEPRAINLNPATLMILAALGAAWLAQFGLEATLGDRAPDLYSRFGVSGAAIRAGHWETLVTSIFIHAGLWHLLGNASALLAFSEPVARAFPPRLGRWLWYPLFFLGCGVAGSLAYLALHPNSTVAAVGASGAISGVWGACARLYRAPPGYISPIFSREVWELSTGFLISNAIIVGGFLLLSTFSGAGITVAWEAHAGGFLFGLLAIGPVLKLAHRAGQ